ncbi:MAG: glutathionylspermidine synthase family protein [Acidobacteriota bacterium]
MRRMTCEPRANWLKTVQDQGLMWATLDDDETSKYWDESAYYVITAEEQALLEKATTELHQMCLKAAQVVIDKKLYAEFGIPEHMVPMIDASWEAEPPSLYGRFDLVLKNGAVKMLEYNADTPTSLLEAAVIQWAWFEDTRYGSDQFNSIHDRLIDTWKYFSDWIKGPVAFTSADAIEDGFTTEYLRVTAEKAGYQTDIFPIAEMGWDGTEFVSGNSSARIGTIFKLYPWEWLAHEEFGQYLPKSKATWIEPAWKMLLSNKGILSVLWDLYPGHPYLLETRLKEPPVLDGWVRKPKLGREGANVHVYGEAETDGDYGEEGFVYQRNANIVPFDGNYPVIGSWIVGQEAAGIGFRESGNTIIANTSRFVPHVME